MKYTLRLFEVRKGERTIALDKDRHIVGRSAEECDIVLDPFDRSVSRTHFSLDKQGAGYLLNDLGLNGTFINGERVGKSGRLIYHGDVIEAGNAELTFLTSSEPDDISAILNTGKDSESGNPSLAIQCYSVAYNKYPDRIEYAFKLLKLLEQESKYEDIITGGDYFNPSVMSKIYGNAQIASYIARAHIKMGDYRKAKEIIDQAGGDTADIALRELSQQIQEQTGGILNTVQDDLNTMPIFQKGNLKIIIEDRSDFSDLRYIERYYKYIQNNQDPIFGGPPCSGPVFHITIRDHLFAQSSRNQGIILGYYSPSNKRIFIRPRRWIHGKVVENEFHITLMHEYVHFRIDGICDIQCLPRWYNEGLAQIISNKMDSNELDAISRNISQCYNIDCFSDATFSPVCGNPAVAYLQSQAIALYLMNSYGLNKLLSVLKIMNDVGGDFKKSFESVLGLSLLDLNIQWRSVLGKQ